MKSQWYCVKDKTTACGFSIKRYKKVDGTTKWEKFPMNQYRDLSLDEAKKLTNRLNTTYAIKKKEAEERYRFEHAFINTRVIERFKSYLESKADDQQHVSTQLGYLEKHAFEFFIHELKIPDPQLWHKHESDWGHWLLKKKLASSTIKQIVQVTNRFLRYISTKIYPEKLTVMMLEPIGSRKLANRKASSKGAHRYKFISEELFEKICKDLKDNEILPNLKLAYMFGLRISETFAISQPKFFADHLLIDEQAISFRGGKLRFGPTKGLRNRQVSYWFGSAKEAYKISKELKPMSPYTLIDKANEALKPYGRQTHDMRRSFVTRALRKYNHRDVQLACGHKDLRTTLSYAQDDRELGTKRLSLDELEG